MRSVVVMMVAAVGLSACSARPRLPARVVLPDTPEATACTDACEQRYQACYTQCGPPPTIDIVFPCRERCAEPWQQCLAACPGAQPKPEPVREMHYY